MRLTDLTISCGSILSRRSYGWDDYAPEALAVCRHTLWDMLYQQRGLGLQTISMGPGRPTWRVGFGLPSPWPAAGTESMFCCYPPPGRQPAGSPEQPFQINALITSDGDSEEALYALATILAMSRPAMPSQLPPTEDALRRITGEMTESLPVLATTLLPALLHPATDREMVMTAADFSTGFALAWIQERVLHRISAEEIGMDAGARELGMRPRDLRALRDARRRTLGLS